MTSGDKTGGLWEALERFLFYIVVASLPLQGVALVPGTTVTVTKAAGAPLILCVAIRLLVQRIRPVFPLEVSAAVLLFGAACLLSVLGAENRVASMGALKVLATYAALFFACLQVAAHSPVYRTAPLVFIWGAAASGVLALCASMGWITPTVSEMISSVQVRRIAVGAFDANEQALLFLFALSFLLLADVWSGGAAEKLLNAFAGVLITAGLLLTMSRTGWLLAIVLVVFVLLSARRHWKVSLAVLACMVAGLSAVALLRPDDLASVKRRALESFRQGDRSAASRVVVQSHALALARDGGAFGHGVGSAEDLGKVVTDPLGRPIRKMVHSVPLMVLLETGWVGGLAFLWLWSAILATLYVGWRASGAGNLRGHVRAYGALMVVYALAMLVMPFMYRSAFPVLLAAALAPIAVQIASAKGPRPA